MQLHIQPFSTHTPSPIMSPPSSHYFTSTKHVPTSSRFKSWFCNSPKRVPESQIILRNYGGLSLNSGFCNSPQRVYELYSSLKNGGYLRVEFCNSSKRGPKLHSDLKSSGDLGVVRCGMELQETGDDCDDGYYMRRAVELARKAIGCTSPNPMVGCVIVKDGKIVGEGFHPKAGQPHAEVFGLRDAGDLAENATAYVTLEPCNHYGRTPPCSEALIKSKVKKVVVGMVDPNPIVASKGVDKLRDAGIQVIVGVEEELCKSLNEPYIHQMLTGKPFLTVRYSLSISGSILNQLGEGVTECGGYYSKLLQEYDAIIFSPALIVEKLQFPASQECGAKQPLQIIIAKTQVSDLTIDASSTVIVFTDKETTVKTETAQKGIETVVLDILNVDTILEYCKRQGCCSVLLDLRGNFSDLEDILSECLEKNLMQKVVIEVLPILEENTEDTDSLALKNLGQKIQSSNLVSKLIGRTVVLEGYF